MPAADSERFADLVADLAGLGLEPSTADSELLAQLTALETLKAATAAAQARVTATFAASRVAAAQAAASDEHDARQARRMSSAAARDAAAQVALARRMSPWQGARAVASARRLVSELPATMAALTAGVLSEHRAAMVERETSLLTSRERAAVDAEVCTDHHVVGRLGDRGLERTLRAAVHRLGPQRAEERSHAAAKERCVTFRQLPDAMCRVSTLLPLAQGAAVHAALARDADAARADGDPRGRGQLMADTLVERVTGQARAAEVPVELQVVISDAALFATGPGAEDPARLVGHGVVPAGWARHLVASRLSDDVETRAAQVWLRRLYATPDSSTLVSMESSRRRFGTGLRRFLVTRDDTCRTPWCDAPIRHLDHVEEHTRGGPTATQNGQGLCESCNYTKQLPGWEVVVVVDDRGGPHAVRWRTPSGATYDSTAPPLLPAASRRPAVSPLESALELAVAA